jgi:riboflavin kinase/FMN adenylyltransferase
VATVYHGSDAYPPSQRPVVTIGNFDGVHRGHRALIEATIAKARSLGVPSCVYTFDPAPCDVLRPGNDTPRIQTLEDRIALLGTLGVDHVVVEPFTLALSKVPPREFADSIIVERLGCTAMVLGWDFCCGAKRAGTTEDLKAWLDIDVRQISPTTDETGVVSSSRIRQLVRSGDVAKAAELLCRPHAVVGRVIRGDGRGRKLGFATANLDVVTPLVPAHGVYSVRVGSEQGVAHIGPRPTFDRDYSVEVHLFDVSPDLYDQTLRVHFVDRIRGNHGFESREALVDQIRQDIALARTQLGTASLTWAYPTGRQTDRTVAVR